MFAPPVIHLFWDMGSEQLRCTAYIHPTDNILNIPPDVFGSILKDGSVPNTFETAYLLPSITANLPCSIFQTSSST